MCDGQISLAGVAAQWVAWLARQVSASGHKSIGIEATVSVGGTTLVECAKLDWVLLCLVYKQSVETFINLYFVTSIHTSPPVLKGHLGIERLLLNLLTDDPHEDTVEVESHLKMFNYAFANVQVYPSSKNIGTLQKNIGNIFQSLL